MSRIKDVIVIFDIFVRVMHLHYIRIHGGDIRLKSWLGFKKSIAVNCNGYVIEGVYPEVL